MRERNSDGVPCKIIDSTPAPEVQMKIKIPFGNDTTDFIFSLLIVILIFEYFFQKYITLVLCNYKIAHSYSMNMIERVQRKCFIEGNPCL